MFLSSGDVCVGELELPQQCQGTFRGSRGKVGFPSRRHSEEGTHPTLRGESPGFSRVTATNLWSLSSYDGDLRDRLVGASGTSSLHVTWEGPHGIPLQSLPGPASPFAVEARISGFLSSVDKDLGVPLGFPQGIRPHFYGDMHVCSPLEQEKKYQASCRVDIGIGGFLSRCHRAVTPAIVF